jgi:hypothetical protein
MTEQAEDRYGPAPVAPTPPPKAAKATNGKGRGKGRGKRIAAPTKPPLPKLDPLEAAQEEARHFKEGNLKLGRAVEALREGLEVITVAEWDHKVGRPVTNEDLRKLAVAALDRYSAIIGQSWRTNRLTGPSRAGTTGNAPVHERSIPDNPPED